MNLGRDRIERLCKAESPEKFSSVITQLQPYLQSVMLSTLATRIFLSNLSKKSLVRVEATTAAFRDSLAWVAEFPW
jgi:hypothetical protein